MIPAVVLKMKFVTARGKDFSKFINYIDRDETKAYIQNNEFEKYTDYMGNPDKSSGVFNREENSLSREQLKTIKEQFSKAQKNDSPLWQIVYSFDNDFLKEQNLLSEDGILNESKIREAVRQSISVIQEKEKFNDTMIWTAAIHYNTDNIHIHVALAEEQTSRKLETFQNKNGKVYEERKGKFQKHTLWNAKSTFANSIVDRTQELTRISFLMRKEINQNIRQNGMLNDHSIFKECKTLMKELPEDLRTWKYNMNAMKPYRKKIDSISKQLIEKVTPEAMEEFTKAIREESKFRSRLYGNNKEGKNFEKEKWKELYAHVGNGLLNEMRQYTLEERRMHSKYNHSKMNNKQEGRYKKGFTSSMIKAKFAFVSGLRQLAKKTKQEFLTEMKLEREAFLKELTEEKEMNQQLGQDYGRGL